MVSVLIYKRVLRQCKGNSSRVWFERSVELHRSVLALRDRDRTQYCVPAGIHRKTLRAWRRLSTSCHYLEPISNKNHLCIPRINGNSEKSPYGHSGHTLICSCSSHILHFVKILIDHPPRGNHEDLYPKFEMLFMRIHFTAHQNTL